MVVSRFVYLSVRFQNPWLPSSKKPSDYHSYRTRIANLYHVPCVKLDLSKTGIKYRGASMWECYCSRRDQPCSFRSCFHEKSNQNVKQWYFLKWAVSCRLTISRSLCHVRHFVTMHMTKDMWISFGAHKPNWVFRSLCSTNLCFQCECYFNLVLYTALCMFVKCDTCNSYGNKIDLIWFDLIWNLADIHTSDYCIICSVGIWWHHSVLLPLITLYTRGMVDWTKTF